VGRIPPKIKIARSSREEEEKKMNCMSLVIVKCPECGAKILTVKGEEGICDCGGYIKHAYSDKEFSVTVCGDGLVVNQVNKGEG
jgi:hypothetical protein